MRIRIITFAAAFAVTVAACSSSSSSKVATSGAASSPTAAPTSAAPSSSGSGSGGYSYGSGSGSASTAAPATTAAPSSGGAQIALSGGHLVAPDGKTVYFLDTESGTTSSCTGGCAAVWPGVASASGAPAGGAGVDATKLSTANGQVPNQVVYNGHLLYEFAGDKAAGDTNGTKIPHWHDVNAAGTAAS
jgi:predicted lipoprotein with Yx(FWY)xxD motif